MSAAHLRVSPCVTGPRLYSRLLPVLLAIACCSLLSGCSLVAGPFSVFERPSEFIGDQIAYNRATDNFILGWRNRAWAHKAWQHYLATHGNPHYTHDYGMGFRAGYIDVAAGANGCPPILPPRRYWSWRYQTPEGQQKMAAWFKGYSVGAAAADKDGIGNWSEIQVAYTHDPEYVQSVVDEALGPEYEELRQKLRESVREDVSPEPVAPPPQEPAIPQPDEPPTEPLPQPMDAQPPALPGAAPLPQKPQSRSFETIRPPRRVQPASQSGARPPRFPPRPAPASPSGVIPSSAVGPGFARPTPKQRPIPRGPRFVPPPLGSPQPERLPPTGTSRAPQPTRPPFAPQRPHVEPSKPVSQQALDFPPLPRSVVVPPAPKKEFRGRSSLPPSQPLTENGKSGAAADSGESPLAGIEITPLPTPSRTRTEPHATGPIPAKSKRPAAAPPAADAAKKESPLSGIEVRPVPKRRPTQQRSSLPPSQPAENSAKASPKAAGSGLSEAIEVTPLRAIDKKPQGSSSLPPSRPGAGLVPGLQWQGKQQETDEPAETKQWKPAGGSRPSSLRPSRPKFSGRTSLQERLQQAAGRLPGHQHQDAKPAIVESQTVETKPAPAQHAEQPSNSHGSQHVTCAGQFRLKAESTKTEIRLTDVETVFGASRDEAVQPAVFETPATDTKQKEKE